MLCLSASAGAVATSLALNAFTLAWTHSIEKLRWEEDWRIEGERLEIVAARIRGTGAGMEIPDDAVLRDGAWHYRPRVAPLSQLRLAHSAYTAGYDLCVEGSCRPLVNYVPGIAASDEIILAPCQAPAR